MYVLTIFRKSRKHKRTKLMKLAEVETFDLPPQALIDSMLAKAGKGAFYDISRKDHEDEDFEYHDEAI